MVKKLKISLSPKEEIEIRLECLKLAIQCLPQQSKEKELIAIASRLQEYLVTYSRQ